MKHALLFFGALATLTFAGCTSGASADLNDNPLYVLAYQNGIADTLSNLIIQNDPITTQTGAIENIQQGIADARKEAQAAEILFNSGYSGVMNQVAEEAVGTVLYLKDTLYFSPDFYVNAGPDVQVYLVPDVDPRGMELPNSTVIDLGPLKSIYGAQSYRVPHQDKPELLRSLVLWDKEFGRMHAFSQLSRSAN